MSLVGVGRDRPSKIVVAILRSPNPPTAAVRVRALRPPLDIPALRP